MPAVSLSGWGRIPLIVLVHRLLWTPYCRARNLIANSRNWCCLGDDLNYTQNQIRLDSPSVVGYCGK